MKFTADNIICVDLIKTTNFQKIINDNNLNEILANDALTKMKESGYTKLWIDRKTSEIIAFTMKGKKEITLNITYIDFLLAIKPIKAKKVKEEKAPLNLDGILDKISEKGMSSLSPTEVKFLEQNSNK